jgi:hypothetical protein
MRSGPAILVLAALALSGCSSTREGTATRFPPPREAGDSAAGEAEAPSHDKSFTYLVQNENCRCEEYTASDKKFPVRYRFRASYRMESGIITSLRISFENDGRDTMYLDPGSVMVSSKNINYQYNNKFLPLPDMVILPGESGDLDLDGKEVTDAPTWKKIAGEQLTLTLKGMRMGEKVLGTQVVRFVPENPMLRETEQ